MPCWELFAEQDLEYQEEVLGDVPRFGIEAACTFGWERWVDHMFGIDSFGASAPAADLYAYFKLTAHDIKDTILMMLEE
jgi:transketolase